MLKKYWNSQLRILIGATVFGTVGEGVFGFSSILAVLHAKGTALSVSVLFVLMTLPSIILAPFQGVFLDRLNIKNLAIISNIVRAVIVLVLALVSWEAGLKIDVLYLAIIVYYIVWYFMVPLSETMVTHVVEDSELHKGMISLQGAWQVGVLGSAFFTGFLLTWIPITGVFIIVAALDVLSALCFTRLSAKKKKVDIQYVKKNFLLTLKQGCNVFIQDMVQGIQHILTSNAILSMVLISAGIPAFFQVVNALLGPFNQIVLHGNALSFGLIEGMAGIGSLISTIICLRFVSSNQLSVWLIISEFFLILFVVIFALSSKIWTAITFYFLVGLFSSNVKILAKSMLVRIIDAQYSGRVFSTTSFLGLVMGVFAVLASGLLANIQTLLGYLVALLIIITGFLITVLFWGTIKSLYMKPVNV